MSRNKSEIRERSHQLLLAMTKPGGPKPEGITAKEFSAEWRRIGECVNPAACYERLLSLYKVGLATRLSITGREKAIRFVATPPKTSKLTTRSVLGAVLEPPLRTGHTGPGRPAKRHTGGRPERPARAARSISEAMMEEGGSGESVGLIVKRISEVIEGRFVLLESRLHSLENRSAMIGPGIPAAFGGLPRASVPTQEEEPLLGNFRKIRQEIHVLMHEFSLTLGDDHPVPKRLGLLLKKYPN